MWRTKELGEVLVRTESARPELRPDDEFEYIDVSSVSNETYKIVSTQRLKGKNAPSRARRLVRAGDILFATVRPTLKRIAIVPNELDGQVCSTGYYVLRAGGEIYGPYLFYYLFTDGFMGQMEKLQKGASYPAVTDSEVRSQLISYPPLAEQRRIVAILDEAFEAIAIARANNEKNLQNSRELIEIVLQEAFTTPVGVVESKTLGTVCTFVGGSQPPKAEFINEPRNEYVRLIQIRDY
jgi:type I restriction enzyme, S subunit